MKKYTKNTFLSKSTNLQTSSDQPYPRLFLEWDVVQYNKTKSNDMQDSV